METRRWRRNRRNRAQPQRRLASRSGACRRKSNILLVLIGIALVFEVLGWIFVGQSFLCNKQRLTIIILQVSVIGIIAVGVTQVIITGGIDLSSGSVVGLTAMMAASLAQTSDFARAVYPSLTDLPVDLSRSWPACSSAWSPALINGSADRQHRHSALHRHARHDGDRARPRQMVHRAASRSAC